MMKHRNIILAIFAVGVHFVSHAWQEQRTLTSDYHFKVTSEDYFRDRAFQAHEPYRFSIGSRGLDRADIKRAQHFARLKARRQQHAMQQQRPSLPSYKTQEPESVDQHYAAAYAVFDDRCVLMTPESAAWRVGNPARFAACERALAERGKTTTHCYQLSTMVRTALHDHGISSDPYYQLHGNALQHELLCEMIMGIEQMSGLHRPPTASFHELLYDHAFVIFDDARFANEMGDCMSSAQLIDCAVAIKDCLYAAVAGAVTGAADGVHNAVVGTYHMIRHPIEAVHALKNLGVIFAGYAHEYLPLEILTEDSSPADWELHAKRCEEVSRKWREAADTLKRQWRDTPTPELLYQASYAVGNVSANVLVGNACLGVLNKTVRWIKREKVFGRHAMLPGSVLISENSTCAPVVQIGMQLGLPTEVLSKVIIGAEAQGIKVATLATTLQKEHESIKQLCQQVDYCKKNLGLKFEKPISYYTTITSVAELDKCEKIAEAGYRAIRNRSDDIEAIAQHTGISKNIIERAKKHLFINEHLLDGGNMARFAPDRDILDTWIRLAEGSFTAFDLEIIPHEYYESMLMDLGQFEYAFAHKQTSEIFPWKP